MRDLAARLQAALWQLGDEGNRLRVKAEAKLAYAHEVRTYDADGKADVSSRPYMTDVLVSEHAEGGAWTPRLVVEGKLGQVSTHDAMTYSAKAAAHKAIHPHLRYGILVGKGGLRVPRRLMWHGAHFDFMGVWCGRDPLPGEWSLFLEVVQDEIRASRMLEQAALPGSQAGSGCQMLHRPLRMRVPVDDVFDPPRRAPGHRA